MKLKNLMEDEVFYAMDKVLKDRDEICKCEKCRFDIAAITLNNLKPRYVVTDKGKLYGRVETLSYQFDADLIKEITKAVEIVSKEPHHE